jgi:hypothetical protein
MILYFLNMPMNFAGSLYEKKCPASGPMDLILA